MWEALEGELGRSLVRREERGHRWWRGEPVGSAGGREKAAAGIWGLQAPQDTEEEEETRKGGLRGLGCSRDGSGCPSEGLGQRCAQGRCCGTPKSLP